MDNQPLPLNFEQILAQMNQAGNFTSAVLASNDGLAVAASPTPSPHDTDTIAAMVTMVKDFIDQTQTRLGLADVDEVAICVNDKSRLVCRYFNAAEFPLVLTVFAPPQQRYRRLMTHAVREIQKSWTRMPA